MFKFELFILENDVYTFYLPFLWSRSGHRCSVRTFRNVKFSIKILFKKILLNFRWLRFAWNLPKRPRRNGKSPEKKPSTNIFLDLYPCRTFYRLAQHWWTLLNQSITWVTWVEKENRYIQIVFLVFGVWNVMKSIKLWFWTTFLRTILGCSSTS